MDELDEVGRVEDGEHGMEEVGDEANVHSYKRSNERRQSCARELKSRVRRRTDQR